MILVPVVCYIMVIEHYQALSNGTYLKEPTNVAHIASPELKMFKQENVPMLLCNSAAIPKSVSFT